MKNLKPSIPKPRIPKPKLPSFATLRMPKISGVKNPLRLPK